MIGIALEASTTCPKCGELVALNALAPKIACVRCATVLEFTVDAWEAILADAMKDARRLAAGETISTSVTAAHYTCTLSYGREHPKYPGTKKKIDLNNADALSGKGKEVDGKSKAEASVRSLPPEYREILPGVTHLVCEDANLLPATTDNYTAFHFTRAEKPQPYSCPQCGGSFKIDGRDRTITCEYCATASYIPDELWQKLHPSALVARWYLWYDESKLPYSWPGEDLMDAVADGNGNLYLIIGDTRKMSHTLVSLSPDYHERWKSDYEPLHPSLALAPEGRLLVWSPKKHGVLVIDSATGSQIGKIGGAGGASSSDGSGSFSMKEAWSLAADIDGTLLVYRPTADDTGSHCELARHAPDGSRLPMWPAENPGLFQKIKKAIASSKEIPYYVRDAGDRIERTQEEKVLVSVGLDGRYYLLHNEELSCYEIDGRRSYNLKLPYHPTYGRACADKDGNAHVIACKTVAGHRDRYLLLRVDPRGNISVFVPPVTEGSDFCDENRALAISGNGTIYAFGEDGQMRAFGPDGGLIFKSESSQEMEYAEVNTARECEE